MAPAQLSEALSHLLGLVICHLHKYVFKTQGSLIKVAHLFSFSLLFQGFRDTEALPVAGSFPTEHLAWMRWIWGTCGVGHLTLTL